MSDEFEVRPAPEDDPPPVREDSGSEHQLWLAMQAAHQQYQTASAALDALTALSPGAFPSSERNLQIEMVAAEQRAAFENYVDARLQLSELLISRRILEPAAATATYGDPEPVHKGTSRKTVLAVIAAFLFPTAFGLGYLARERNHIQGLETARDEANAVLAQTRDEVLLLTRKVDGLRTAQASQASVLRKAMARNLQKTAARRPRPIAAAARNLAPAANSVARNHQELLQLQRRGDRSYREFALSSRRHYERIGPIALTVLKVDPYRKYFDVAIAVDSMTPSRMRMNLYEPVWIDLKGRPKAVEMVINRIEGEEVQGYLSEARYPRVSSRSSTNQASELALP